ncbi:LacI family DNA-binding transcriptional regulator [Arcticibacterium luteifluviistationis]|uniref:LacI family transcriptional regulator n=1 Tax=Arcticibacterium luteifluviistationis TaxID=1784714 RepID=A0A2Z4GBG7_9BACT|nr:LacI family DNA-binding transcriptional regulator [Arcticibacterium luteifluviistationis]AWV98390.1 LacI family transcriptional regulator [Arcticibacterium luteifluviistationis]
MKTKAPTIKLIAKELGVSISTVSRALRDMPEVNPETRRRIMKYAEEVDYQPNMVATSLVNQNSRLIGVIVPNMDYFFASAVKGIDEAAMEAGYTVVISQSNESYGRELANTQRIMGSQVEGLIVSLSSETQNIDHIKKILKRNKPVVFFDRDTPDIRASKVVLDNELGAYKAVKHLISKGCKRIAYLGAEKNLQISNSREQGYLKALKEANMSIDESLIVHGKFEKDNAYLKTMELLRLKTIPDAIFAISDRLALGAYMAIKDKGLRMPEDIALVGFNDEPIMSLLSPSISSVSQPAFEMGKMAARLFIEQLNSGEEFEPRTEIFQPELKIRDSSTF